MIVLKRHHNNGKKPKWERSPMSGRPALSTGIPNIGRISVLAHKGEVSIHVELSAEGTI